MQDISGVWTDVILLPRYLGMPKKTVRHGGATSGTEELSASTVTFAVPGLAGASVHTFSRIPGGTPALR